MQKLAACFCFKARVSEFRKKDHNDIQISEPPKMERSTFNDNKSHSEKPTGIMIKREEGTRANIIVNHDFSKGLDSWHANSCEASVVSGEPSCGQGLSAFCNGNYAVLTNRKECWQGLEQEITGKVVQGRSYTVCADVGVSGLLHGYVDVQATLKLENKDSATSYLFIARTSVTNYQLGKLEGTFTLENLPDRIVFYIEGPSPGIDLHIKSVVISCPTASDFDVKKSTGYVRDDEGNIILNPVFDDGLNNWSGRSCKIAKHDSMANGKIVPKTGKFFAASTERTQTWNGIQQEITGRVQRKLAYEVTALVRIFGNNLSSAEIRATLWVQAPDLREEYIGIANIQATDKDWVQLQGKFVLNSAISKAVVYLEGPPPGTDILLNSLVVKHARKALPHFPPRIENSALGVNIITNSAFIDGTNGWFPLGNCNLSVGTGSPLILPTMAKDSLGPHEPLSGNYVLTTNRTQNWMGPAQIVTDRITLYLTYQVSGWVRVSSIVGGAQTVNVAFGVDDQWVNGGQVEVVDDTWHEISGSFRIEKRPGKVMVYVQGPAPGVDLMVAGLQIFPVDRRKRFKYLREQTDKVRKRDVILKFTGSDSICPFGTFVKVRQTENTFPFGSCLSRSNIDNNFFVDFFVKHFNWAVFGNELKWYWTEPQKGKLNYKDSDDLLNFCNTHNIKARGHCIFWDVDETIQSWVKDLNKNDLTTAVQNRLTSLLSRYKGQFQHYDVNNEMLHGSFFQDRLGKDIRANMFKTAHKLDSSPILFVNDYHVEDRCDLKSSPEQYIHHILDLQEQGAPIGGIGIQGHIDNPIGPIICSAIDKLGVLGLPIWFTEVDVSSSNEYVRAEDLEVMLREMFAHPAVDGIMLWGFWELFMSRENAHLVNAEGEINEAGKRYIDLKQEWLSMANGHVDEEGHFEFRGFQGKYEVEILGHFGKVSREFYVAKGTSPIVIPIDL
ncbi:endo-1,4-beta-xylanase 3-like isoform X2 [Impatiens glandulifera]|uniref:endo-1,4-beta-xylanase 3-like isoform X2 n=1 Tax=Impatiens glandulifera TaxID=253017 RepID=UPI001FB18A2F|nr:endo-1,4-beta-xylanase 3-like isoform X2 [Impatiens glandulifera]